jgi:hypothetical protein
MEKILKLKEKIKKLKASTELPRLFLSDYLDQLRNEIDLATEACIALPANQTTFAQLVKHGKNLNHEKINMSRTLMFEKIEQFEKLWFKEFSLNNKLEAKYAKQLSDSIQNCEEKLMELINEQEILGPKALKKERSDLELKIDTLAYEFYNVIQLNTSLVFINSDDIRSCIRFGDDINESMYKFCGIYQSDNEEDDEEADEDDEKPFFKAEKTCFGFLCVLNDCVSKESFR